MTNRKPAALTATEKAATLIEAADLSTFDTDDLRELHPRLVEIAHAAEQELSVRGTREGWE